MSQPSSLIPSLSRRQLLLQLTCGAGLLSLSADPSGAGESDQDRDIERIAARIQANPVIQRGRTAALDVLKPSSRDLEHGLQLHAQSLVFDAYGFAPRAAIDAELYSQAFDEGASDAELQDLSEDMSMTRAVSDPSEREEFEIGWRAAGVTCIFQNAGEECQAPLRLIKRLARFTYLTDMLPDLITKAATPDEILAARQQGRGCLYFTGNGVPLTEDWLTPHDELKYVRIFFQLGVRMMHVTYQRRNMLGDGCGEAANGGLSDFGRQAIAEMNRVGVIVDVAHSGWQTSLEAAQASQKPIAASHTTAAALHHHIRSKPDEVLKAIAEKQGYVGVCCIPEFLGARGDIAAFLDHIDYLVKLIGVDHVAIGTDIAYTSRNDADQRKKLPKNPRKNRLKWASLWPANAFAPVPGSRDSLMWTNWPLFTVGLVQRGYKDDDIRKILGENVLRVTRAALAPQG
ncbi:MAG: membrane dipeptidase [Planctomycetes bacterium]|nr:membrane dipeptidase [Planctomycetota bacterium]